MPISMQDLFASASKAGITLRRQGHDNFSFTIKELQVSGRGLSLSAVKDIIACRLQDIKPEGKQK